VWDPDIFADGVEYPNIIESGKINSFAGVDLNNPRVSAIRLNLEGVAPVITSCDKQIKNITILQIEELDEWGRVFEGSVVSRHAIVIYTGDCISPISAMRSDLQTFRSHIEEFTAMGVDTSDAEVKYNTAKTEIDSASTIYKIQKTAVTENLTAARADIFEGERLLDKAWTDKEIADAQVPLRQTDEIISWFKGNKSTADDERLPAIIAKRDLADAALTSAENEIANGNYSAAREKAPDVYDLGSVSYNEAISRQYVRTHTAVGCFGFCGGISLGVLILPAICIVVIAIISVGIFWWRKKKGGETP